jgi:DeoR family transcriptional regulator, suf operon transcriptional repressor
MVTGGASSPVRSPVGVSVAPPIPVGRRAVLYAVRRIGDATVEDVATHLGITVSGARQHLSSLAEHGLAEAVEIRDDPPRRGRPRLIYHVSELGDLLFPKAYGALTNELLGYVGESGEDAIDRLFTRRRDHRIANAEERLERHRSLAGKVAELTAILDEDGYLASWEQLNRDHFLIVEHNCAIAAVAATYRQACSSELEFIRAVLPDAEITRVRHMASGDRSCAYDVRRQRQTAE